MSRSGPARIAARGLQAAVLAAVVALCVATVLPPAVPRETDGAVPERVRVFDDDLPAVANLDPRLLRALRTAASYELRREAIDNGCPVMYADPRHDPRMHQ